MSENNPPADHVITDDRDEKRPIEEHLKSRSTWLRLLFMVIFSLLAAVAELVGSVVIVLGFLWVLFTGKKNPQLQQTGQVVAGYLYEIVRYLTFNTDEKPFPFGASLPPGRAERPKQAL